MQLRPWKTPDVWITLQSLIHEQLGIDIEKITETATFVDDLGCD